MKLSTAEKINVSQDMNDIILDINENWLYSTPDEVYLDDFNFITEDAEFYLDVCKIC